MSLTGAHCCHDDQQTTIVGKSSCFFIGVRIGKWVAELARTSGGVTFLIRISRILVL